MVVVDVFFIWAKCFDSRCNGWNWTHHPTSKGKACYPLPKHNYDTSREREILENPSSIQHQAHRKKTELMSRKFRMRVSFSGGERSSGVEFELRKEANRGNYECPSVMREFGAHVSFERECLSLRNRDSREPEQKIRALTGENRFGGTE